MDHFDLDISLDHRDEDFDFGNQLSSASSSRSFSTAPSCAPVTPQSGRSTPKQNTVSMTYGLVFEDELTSPPVSSYADEYLTSNIKMEFPALDTYPLTPSRESTTSPYNMDIHHAPLLHSNVSGYGNVMEFHNQNTLENCSFSDQLAPYSFDLAPPSYSLHNPTWDNASVWASPSDTSLSFLDRSDTTPLVTTLENVSFWERSTHQTPYLQNSTRRQLPMENSQRRSGALHRIQNGGVPKRGKFQPNVVASAEHKCLMTECASKDAGKRGYKRAEHLKRHMRSAHSNGEDDEVCKYCNHVFNRKDNYKSHLALHTKHEKSSTSRTDFHPEAVTEYNEIMAQTKRRNTTKISQVKN